ncbi:MAG: type I-U CRISPR-associated protein Csb2 [Rhodospirillales bacterium]|nr:type I-U CRISPR-associated protein Csb2 [Rhodospirillales bacterium]
MPGSVLLFSVHLHDHRWHGAGEWPPSPGRLFQALVAGVASRAALSPEHPHREALEWLEGLAPPAIAVPGGWPTKGFQTYVPNNDLDAVNGDIRRIGEIRVGKTIRPRLFEGEAVLLFAWDIDAGEDAERHAAVLGEVARCLYQFGRGVDIAWADAEVLADGEADARIARHDGEVWRPAKEAAAGGTALRCPRRGTLKSLLDREEDRRKRLLAGVLRQPRQPALRIVAYNCPPDQLLFDLKPSEQNRRFEPWPLVRVAELATRVRDYAAKRLSRELAGQAGMIERILIGRGASERDKAQRVRIIPLPSIGHTHTDTAIRRVLIERPCDCPIRGDDLNWALSGLDLAVDPETGELPAHSGPILAPADDRSMLRHYGIEPCSSACTWRTVTPVALPVPPLRGRAKGSERLENEMLAAHAVAQALRHAGVGARLDAVRVQREPFFSAGIRAEAFASATRFPSSRLWHAEITFGESVTGPLVIGDGRYCGLGIMMPLEARRRDALILPIRAHERPPVGHRRAVIAALRRALMSLAADAQGFVATLFSGHATGTEPARPGQHRHVYLLADDADGDGLLDRLGVVAPWRVDRSWHPRLQLREDFEHVAGELRVLRAGAAGLLSLDVPHDPAPDDPLFASSRAWRSRTPYQVTARSLGGKPARAAVERDVVAECGRRGLPKPDVVVAHPEDGSGRGSAGIILHFSAAVPGPIMLGRDAHAGGGLFEALRYCVRT